MTDVAGIFQQALHSAARRMLLQSNTTYLQVGAYTRPRLKPIVINLCRIRRVRAVDHQRRPGRKPGATSYTRKRLSLSLHLYLSLSLALFRFLSIFFAYTHNSSRPSVKAPRGTATTAATAVPSGATPESTEARRWSWKPKPVRPTTGVCPNNCPGPTICPTIPEIVFCMTCTLGDPPKVCNNAATSCICPGDTCGPACDFSCGTDKTCTGSQCSNLPPCPGPVGGLKCNNGLPNGAVPTCACPLSGPACDANNNDGQCNGN